MNPLLLIGFITLIELHAPTGQSIYLNANEITSIREPTGSGLKHLVPGTKCVVVMSNAQFSAVRETCDEVRHLLDREHGQ